MQLAMHNKNLELIEIMASLCEKEKREWQFRLNVFDFLDRSQFAESTFAISIDIALTFSKN